MAKIGIGGDLLSNFQLSGGRVGCHSSWDLCTTITGDLALTKDYGENNRQRLLMWMAIPKGEAINSDVGCCLYDYFHAKITGDLPRRLELDVRKDLKEVFPDLDVRNVNVQKVESTASGNREMLIAVTIGNDSLEFVANFNTLVSINSEINDLIYYSGATEA